MRRLFAAGGAFACLCACSTPFGFGGEDWAGDTAADNRDTTPGGAYDPSAEDSAGPTVIAAHAVCTDVAGTGLFVDVNGSNAWVTHDGFATGCGGSWSVAITPDANDGTQLSADYAPIDSSDCSCAGWEIEYVISGLGDVSYRLNAGGQSVGFDVGGGQ